MNGITNLASKAWESKELQIPNDTCMYTMQLPFDQRCDFVHTDACSFDNIHFLKPYKWIFCVEDQVSSVIGTIGMCITTLLLFIIISVVADAFVCPCVAVIANALQLSDNIAGVTLLAFGNGSPDLFASFAGAELDHPEILYAGMTGSALFVTCVIAGLIIWARPFKVDAWPLVINCSFLIITYLIIFFGFMMKNFDLVHCIGILVVYVAYMSITIAADVINVKHERVVGERVRESVLPPQYKKQRLSVTVDVLIERERKRSSALHTTLDKGYDWKELKPLFMEFFEALATIKKEDWKESNTRDKIGLIIQGVNRFWMQFFLPVVNPEQPRNGWSKLLVMINMLLYPSFVLFSLNWLDPWTFEDIVQKSQHKYNPLSSLSLWKLVEDSDIDITIYGFPVWAISLALGFIGFVVVFFTTRSYAQPKHHTVLAFLGFIASVLMIRIIAQEIIIHLETIGARCSFSQPFLALTLLSFGNSIGDLVINYGLAKQGMQNMGFAACFGGPLFNLSLGVGIISVIVIIKTGHQMDEFYGALSPGGSMYLLISVVFSLLVLSLLDFEARPSYGMFLVTLYLVYIILTSLMETVIHPFGTQLFRHRPADDD